MSEQEKPYLFITMDIWKQVNFEDFLDILKLEDTYNLITTDLQVLEIKRLLLFQVVKDASYLIFLDDVEILEELKTIDKTVFDFYNKIIELIENNFTQIFFIINEKVDTSEIPILIDSLQKDKISLDYMIHSAKLIKGVDIYLYTDHEEFLFQKTTIHPLLNSKCKISNRSYLRRFYKSTPPVTYVISQQRAKFVNKKTPKYLKQRFINLMDLIDAEINYTSVNKQEIQIMLKECQNIIESLTNVMSPEYILIMKNKRNHFKTILDSKK